MRRYIIALVLLVIATPLYSRSRIQGYVEAGNTSLTITGGVGNITRKVQGSYPLATVTVYISSSNGVSTGTYTSGGVITGSVGQTCSLLFTGGIGGTATVSLTGLNTIASGTNLVITASGRGYTPAPTSATLSSGTATCSGTATVTSTTTPALATIYSDNSGTLKSNPFTAASDGSWFAYVDNGAYDVRFSGTPVPTPYTISAIAAYSDSDMWVNVKSSTYGAVGDGSADDTQAIQAAITAGAGKLVYIPPGTYKITSPLVISANTTIQGLGDKLSAHLVFTNLTDGFQSTWPINSSTAANITIRNLYIQNTNAANTGGGFADIGGTYIHLIGCRFQGFKYGVIFDQTEISEIESSEFWPNVITTAAIWLVDGAEHTIGAAAGYTNRITITRNQINQTGAGVGIADDGGINHSIRDNSFEGGTTQIRVSRVGGLVIENNEMENATVTPISFNLTKLGGTANTLGNNARITNNLLLPTAGLNCITLVANSIYSLSVEDNYAIVSSGGKGVNNADLIANWYSAKNVLLDTGVPSNSLNSDYDQKVFTTTLKGSVADPVLGNGTLVAYVSRHRKEITVRITCAAGSTTTWGTGQIMFTLPVTPSAYGYSNGSGAVSGNVSGTAPLMGAVLVSDAKIYLYDGSGSLTSTSTRIAAPNTLTNISIQVTYHVDTILE